MYIDTHAHLESLEEIDEKIQRAKDAGVEKIISMSTRLESCYKTIGLAEQYEGVYAAVGIHPHSASSFSETVISEIEKLAKELL